MKAATQELQHRFISCLPMDETFNRVKARCAAGSNTRLSATSIQVNAIDNGVFDKLNHFDLVDSDTAVCLQGERIPQDVFEAPLRASTLPECVRDLNFGRIVGTGEAEWYSPAAESLNKPLAELVAARKCDAAGNLDSLQFCWLSQLCSGRFFRS